MKFVVTGAGQIGQELAVQLLQQGHAVTVVRRSAIQVRGTRTVQSDVGDRRMLARELSGAAAVFHCVHTAYNPSAWRRDLPARETAVMDAAADLGIPVVFPESVYAFGREIRPLIENSEPTPCSPLGEVRAELIQARARHRATTVSVVAGDLVGHGATSKGSIPTATVIEPTRRGQTAWVLGDPDARHAMTVVADLARAMIAAALNAHDLTATGSAVLNAPSPQAVSMRELASLVAQQAGRAEPKVREAPAWPLRVLGTVSPTTRSLWHQRYLWNQPSTLAAGLLSTACGVSATPWAEALPPLPKATAGK